MGGKDPVALLVVFLERMNNASQLGKHSFTGTWISDVYPSALGPYELSSYERPLHSKQSPQLCYYCRTCPRSVRIDVQRVVVKCGMTQLRRVTEAWCEDPLASVQRE
eukprot:3496550-Rhodomonas_salina.1